MDVRFGDPRGGNLHHKEPPRRAHCPETQDRALLGGGTPSAIGSPPADRAFLDLTLFQQPFRMAWLSTKTREICGFTRAL